MLDELSEQSAFSPGQDKHPLFPDKSSEVTGAQTLLTFYSCQRDVIRTWEVSLGAIQTSPGPSPTSEAIPELIRSRVLLPLYQGQDHLVPRMDSPNWGAAASPWDAAFSRCPLMQLPMLVAVPSN